MLSVNPFALIQGILSVHVTILPQKTLAAENLDPAVVIVSERMRSVEPLLMMMVPNTAPAFGSHREHAEANPTRVRGIVLSHDLAKLL